jgi:soluble lytic murein transglycosylase-like protein
MRVLILLIILTSCATQSQPLDEKIPKACQRYLRAIEHYAHNANIEKTLALSVVIQESSCNPKARSHKGAVGLTQLIPKWHAHKGNITEPYENLKIGFEYLRELYEQDFSIKNALAKYYAGNNGHLSKVGMAYAQEVLDRRKLL